MSERTAAEFDIIFVGGGAAGCVTAGRLAAANANLKILILEAGPHSLDVDTHVQPARYVANFLSPNKLSKSFTLHVAQPSEAVANRKVIVAASRVLGGGSSVNFMVYTRASASDYDTWEVVHENPGWGSKELIPLLKEIETYTLPTSNSTHGKEGPLKISFPDNNINVGQQFLDVAGSYDKERRVTDDWNNFETGNGYGIWAKYIDDKTGQRSDTAHHFVYSQPGNKNLTVLAESRAIRVLFEDTRAVGVEYVTANAQSPSRVYASKLVVLSSGTFGSSAILERSGIGGKDVLSKNGVVQLIDLPGVGEEYKDHDVVPTHFAASPEAETMSHIFHATSEEALQSDVQQWKESGKGWMAHNGIDAGCKLRPSLEDVQTMGPAFEKRWKDFFESLPDKPVVFAGKFAGLLRSIVPRPTLPDATEKYFGVQYGLTYPASTGSVHITNALDPYAPLNFHHGYLEEEADVAEFRWVYKHLREIARRMPLYRGELPEWHPTFPVGSDAASKAVNTPVGIDAPKLVYTAEDDAAIDEFHRNRGMVSFSFTMGVANYKLVLWA
ncbi:hypothetical protein EST38_g10804 [Candolleomyces aberdarensis]|uniref:Glucose-methanol-choline oxidoreductase N-terminal domain-containing protein n=1 Tax=Candolleomyces aberdarensis TaxID=2316362 RepID=A0A4Q2D8V7_9AGAR|nr:hypothetical protein EST38_g10804 [Candolleomyces aberdarensis]